MNDELTRAKLCCELPTLLATGAGGKRLWMLCNAALGTMTFSVLNGDGRSVCETLSLERAIDAYNDLKAVAA
jgi:hypothetical protein